MQSIAGPDVTVSLLDSSPQSDATPVRKDVVDAYAAAVATRFPGTEIVPTMSAGATDGSYLRNAGLPVYGFGGYWAIIGEREGVHGLDEKVLIDGFHGQVPIWEEMLRRVAG